MKYIFKMGPYYDKYVADIDIDKVREYYDLEACDTVQEALSLYAIDYGTRVNADYLKDLPDTDEVWITDEESEQLLEAFDEIAIGTINLDEDGEDN